MEQTQLLEWEEENGDPPGGEANGEAPRPVGRLHLLSSKYGPEQDFWIYPGENVVGRLQSCRVCLPAPSVSKAHAVIEVPAPGCAPILRVGETQVPGFPIDTLCPSCPPGSDSSSDTGVRSAAAFSSSCATVVPER
uniref:FHA domain-containing protein n=1 Tax=Chelydra serpentina TaxID=8475 RepID=A0A8C3SD67_CHESE